MKRQTDTRLTVASLIGYLVRYLGTRRLAGCSEAFSCHKTEVTCLLGGVYVSRKVLRHGMLVDGRS